jgi:PAS domain S-box-containing protein
MNWKYKISLGISILIMAIFFTTQSLLVFNFMSYADGIGYFGYSCFLAFIPFFSVVISEYIKRSNKGKEHNDYVKKLNTILINQTHNKLFYDGNVKEGAKVLTKEVTKSIGSDRCSIWLYNEDKTLITCQQLYIESEDKWYQELELKKEDFDPYFVALSVDPIIIADDAETHPATSCFTEGYLKPLGVKSMLDVPIIYRGNIIGVVCIENLKSRNWKECEVHFAQLLASLYSFAYSVKETNDTSRRSKENEKFLNESSIVSVADSKGKITYVNPRFEEISGWSLNEVIGKDHSIVNSGLQPDGYWGKMYETVMKGEIWNDIVTNKSKSGELYYVDTYIRAIFDSNGKLEGFSSIRQDVTDLKKKEVEIRNRMNAINKSNAVIEFDLKGNIIFANNLFVETMGYSSPEEVIGKHHRIFIEDDHSKSKEYLIFWEKLNSGILFSGEITRIKKDGSLVYLQATYNPIVGLDGKIYRIMKIATDITNSYEQKKEIEKKNTYLEHAAKILRHDMHSGINTYMPRGLSSLERRLTSEDITSLKIEAPIKMIKEGLKHSQKVYKGVYEFTNLVKKDVVLNKTECNLKNILEDYLSSTAYSSQVIIDELPTIEVNEALFCTAVDNLIRNGLKYNDSDTKYVKIYSKENYIYIQDNGRGISQEDFDHLCKPYTRKEGQKESGTGLGLNICVAILEEHGFIIQCEKNEIGTKMKIKIKKND